MCEQFYNSTHNEITCQLRKDSGLKSGIAYSVEVLVKNFGFALHDGSFSVNYLPKVTDIYPLSGSVKGGTKVNIIGDGFNGQTTFAKIGPKIYYPGVNLLVTNSKIILTTYPTDEGSYVVQVFVDNKAVEHSGSNTFNFSLNSTPVVESVFPTEINKTSSVTLIGTNFGNFLISILEIYRI